MFAVRQYCHGKLITENRRPSVGFGRNCIGVNSNMIESAFATWYANSATYFKFCFQQLILILLYRYLIWRQTIKIASDGQIEPARIPYTVYCKMSVRRDD